jgi:transposase
MASFLGLTPREYSTGLHRRLGRISKRGDVYLANKLARISWAVWKNDRHFEPMPELQAA